MFVCIKKWYPIFQSALPRGERPDPVQGSPEQGNFNPRSHEGSDICIGWYPTCGRYFNPRSHEGSDHFSYPPKDINTVFQSALPRGERLAAALVNAFA